MSYPLNMKLRIMEYRNSGHSILETHKEMNVSVSTIYRWEKQWKEQGHLRNKVAVRSHKKIDPEMLKAYMKFNPDVYLKEIAHEFNCSITAVQKALKRNGIVRKNSVSVQNLNRSA